MSETLPPELRTTRLLLRRIEEEDAEDVVSISFYDGVPAASAEDARRMLRRIDEDQRSGNSLHWGVALAGGDEILGTCGYYRGLAGGTGEIGYVMKEQHRGRGIMTEAVRAIVRHGFEALGLTRIVAYTATDNVPSRALLERVGFRATGQEQEGFLEYAIQR